MPEPEDFPIPFPMPFGISPGSDMSGSHLRGLGDSLRNGPVMLSRVTDAAAKAGQAIAARQAQHVSDSMSDMRVLLSDSAPKANDPTAMARAYAAFLQAGMQRNLALVSFLAQTMAAMTQQMLAVPPLVQPAAEDEPDPHAANGVHVTNGAASKAAASKGNGRAASAKA